MARCCPCQERRHARRRRSPVVYELVNPLIRSTRSAAMTRRVSRRRTRRISRGNTRHPGLRDSRSRAVLRLDAPRREIGWQRCLPWHHSPCSCFVPEHGGAASKGPERMTVAGSHGPKGRQRIPVGPQMMSNGAGPWFARLRHGAGRAVMTYVSVECLQDHLHLLVRRRVLDAAKVAVGIDPSVA